MGVMLFKSMMVKIITEGLAGFERSESPAQENCCSMIGESQLKFDRTLSYHLEWGHRGRIP